MADGQPSGPGIDNSFLYRQMMAAQGQGGSGVSMLLFLSGLGHGRIEVNTCQQLSPQGKGLNCEKPMPTLQPAGRMCLLACLADKMQKALQSIPDDVKKRAGEAGVIYQGHVTNGAPVISNIASSGGNGPTIGS